MGLWVEIQYGGDWWGEDPLTETEFETTGDLFRALAGKDKSRPWIEPLGRCTGKVYVDTDQCVHSGRYGCDRAKHLQFGDESLGHSFAAKARQVGWHFEARNPEPVRRGDEQPTGLREAWVIVHEQPPTVTRVEHFADFGA